MVSEYALPGMEGVRQSQASGFSVCVPRRVRSLAEAPTELLGKLLDPF
jgi:hypothetical protein